VPKLVGLWKRITPEHSGTNKVSVQHRRCVLMRRVMGGDTPNLLRALCEALAKPLPKKRKNK